MTVRAIQGVSGLSEVAFIGSSRVRRRVSLAEQLPQIASPSVSVTLGANQSAPSLYNAAGLFQSYLQADSAKNPTGPLPGSNEALLQGELKTLLRLNSDTSNSGILNATGVTASLSASALQALNNVIANRLGEAGGSERSQTESELLLQLLNLSSSRLSGATADLNIGALSQGSIDANSFSALLNSILGSGLDLSSLPIGSLIGGAGFFGGGLASLLGSGGSGEAGLFGLATPDLLDIGAPGIFNLNVTGAQAPGNSSEADARASAGLARQAGAEGSTPASDRRDVAAALLTSNVPDSSAAPIIVSQPSPQLAVNQAAQTLPASVISAVTITPNQTTDPARTAINTVAGNPTFAESVASLYLSAAVFRAQHHPGDESVPETLTEVQAISGVPQVPRLEAR
ncbi:MAG: hypothetical protein K9J42_07820 [Sulfuritalea sp.]|nr:hypothetical protein [Sulfuritalea sp.]